MAGLERRLVLLLDQARFDRVSAEATRTKRSVASIVREAIDMRFPSDSDARCAALVEFLALTATPAPGEVGEDWADIKRSDADAFDRELSW